MNASSNGERGLLTSRRTLLAMRSANAEPQRADPEEVKQVLLRFAERLQARYPFQFAKAKRDLPDEINREAQERLVTHFLFGAVAETSGLHHRLRDEAWALGGKLIRHLGVGGENFCPTEFDPEEKRLAHDIGERRFEELMRLTQQLGSRIQFRDGPVNATEHVLAWSFRYVWQMLKAAKWEGAEHLDPHRRV